MNIPKEILEAPPVLDPENQVLIDGLIEPKPVPEPEQPTT